MALPDSLVLNIGTEIVIGVNDTFNPADTGTRYSDDTTVDYLITLASLANGAGRQSAKIDLTADRPPSHAVFTAVDFTLETPVSGNVVEYYWAPSTHATTGIGNIAGNSGADAVCPGGATPSGITLAEFVKQCISIGNFIVSDDVAVQGGYVGTFMSPTRYGQIIVKNESGDAFESDDVENHVVLKPIVEAVID